MLKFLPLLQLAPKLVQSLSEGDLMQLAGAFVPKTKVAGIVSALSETKDMSGDDAVAHILQSDAAKDIMSNMQQETEEAERAIFCRCPNCQFTFEVALAAPADAG